MSGHMTLEQVKYAIYSNIWTDLNEWSHDLRLGKICYL